MGALAEAVWDGWKGLPKLESKSELGSHRLKTSSNIGIYDEIG